MTDTTQRQFPPHWAKPGHPVFHLEVTRWARNRTLWLSQNLFAPASLALVTLLVTIVLSPFIIGFSDLMDHLVSRLTIFVIFMSLLQALVGAVAGVLTIAQVSPMISGEIEAQSWALLRSTTLSLREIILAKLAAAAYLQRGLLGTLALIRFITTMMLLTGTAYLPFYWLYWDDFARTNFLRSGVWVSVLVAVLLTSIWYFFQPLIQFVLNATISFVVSAQFRSRSRALAMGLAIRLGLWVGSAILNGMIIYFTLFLIYGNWANPAYAPIEAFHGMQEPTRLAVLGATSLSLIVYVVLLLGSQIAMIFGGLAHAQRRIRYLEL